MVVCPSCGRKFNSRVADDHIKFCKEKKKIDDKKKKWGKLATKDKKTSEKPKKEVGSTVPPGKFESPIRERYATN